MDPARWHIEWLIDGQWEKWQCPNGGGWYDKYEDQFDAESALPVVMLWTIVNKATAVRSVSPEGQATKVWYVAERKVVASFDLMANAKDSLVVLPSNIAIFGLTGGAGGCIM